MGYGIMEGGGEGCCPVQFLNLDIDRYSHEYIIYTIIGDLQASLNKLSSLQLGHLDQ